MQYFQAIIYSVCTICNGELITRGWNNCIDLIAKITCFRHISCCIRALIALHAFNYLSKIITNAVFGLAHFNLLS